MIAHLPLRKHFISARLFKKIAPWFVFAMAIICDNHASAQNVLDKLGLNGSTPATGAYALRVLSSSYTGPLARVNINNSYYDVYPDASAAGALSLSSPISASYVNYNDAKTGPTGDTLSNILGSNNAFAAIWYDQSGSGNDELQSDPNYQPVIAFGGSIYTSSGQPTIYFSGRYLRAVLPSLNPVTSHTLIGVASAASGNIVALSSATAGYQNSCLGAGRSGQAGAWFGGYFQDSNFETGGSSSVIAVRTKTYTPADSTIRGYVDGSYDFLANSYVAGFSTALSAYHLTTPDILLGYQNTGLSGGVTSAFNESLNGSASEVLVFTTALTTTERQAVESNQAGYYGFGYNHDAPQAAAAASPLTLDKAGLGGGVQATAAYSVRQLSSAYTGPVARLSYVPSGSFAPLYYDVYPDAATGALSPNSPVAAVGSTLDGTPKALTGTTLTDLAQPGRSYTVFSLFDQSGNGNNALQYSRFLQPALISNGNITTAPAGSPALSFTGSNTMRAVLSSLDPATAHTLNGVAAGTSGDILTLSSTPQKDQNSTMGITNSGSRSAAVFGGWAYFNSYGGTPTTAAAVRTKVYSPGSINGYFNGADLFTSTATTYNLTTRDIVVGSEVVNGGQNLNGTLSEAIVFTSALSDNDRKALEKNQANFYKTPYLSPNTTTPRLLDSLTATGTAPATGAYALRLLNKNYTGPLARVNINNSYYDVYPDTTSAQKFSLNSPVSNPYVNYNDPKIAEVTSTLSDILGSNNAFVAIWYDQSGNGNDELQSDPNYQPVIAFGGSIYTSSGQPAIYFSGRYLRAVLPSLNPVTSHTLIGVASAASGNIVALSSATAGYQNSCLGAGRSGQAGAWFGGYFQDSNFETGGSSSVIAVRTKTYTPADSTIRGYVDGSYDFLANSYVAGFSTALSAYHLTTPDILLGYQNTGLSGGVTSAFNESLNGSASEVLVFTTALTTTERQAVESNQAGYYGFGYIHDAPQAAAAASPLTLDKAGLGGGVQATAAYSVRQLSSAYTGPVARLSYVPSGSFAPLYYDVYPDAATGALSPNSPVAAVGSTLDGTPKALTGTTLTDLAQPGRSYTVFSLFDQSGNGNNALQYSRFLQPALISNGNITTAPADSPALSFTGSNTMRAVLSSLDPATAHTLNGVAAGTSGDILTLSSTPQKDQNSTMGITNSGSRSAAVFGGWAYFNSYGGTPTTAAAVRTKVYSPGSINGYFNGADLFTSTATTYNLTTPDILLGSEVASGGQNLNGTLSEAIVFTSALSNNDRKALEKNQANFYSVTLTTKLDTIALSGTASPTKADSLTYTLTFEDAVTGLTANNFTLSASAGITGASVGTPATSDGGLNWTVPVHTGSGDGTLTLKFANTQNLSLGVINALPDSAATVTIDRTSPSATTITATTPSNSIPTKATSVTYTVTFSEPVTGVDAGDFSLETPQTVNHTTANGTVSGVSGSGDTYQVTVTVGGTGTLKLDLNASGTGIQDLAGNAITTGFTTGDVYTIDNTLPQVTSGSYFSNNGFSSQYAKVGDQINLFIGFDGTLVNPTMTIGGNPVSIAGSNNNSNWSGSITMTSSDTEGNVPWTFDATDQAGNHRLYQNTDFGTFLVFDKTPPVPVISAPSRAVVSSNGVSPDVTYNVSYTDANFNFSTLSLSDVTLNTTGTANATITNVSGSGNSYTVTVSNFTGLGTLGISIGAGTGQDIPGNIAVASSPSPTFTIDNTKPAVAISGPSQPVIGTGTAGTVTYTVTYTDDNFNASTLAVTDITLHRTGNANGTLAVTGTGATRTVTISAIGGLGTLGISVGAGTATDQAGNIADGAGPSATFMVKPSEARLNTLSLRPKANFTKVEGPDYIDYTANVSQSTSSVTVIPVAMDTNASITVNGAAATSGVESAPVALNADTTAIAVTVTAVDGLTKKTYRIVVTRAPSSEARLNIFALNPKSTFTKVSGPDYADYTTNVPAATTSVTVFPVTKDANATLTINSAAAVSGVESAPVSLNADTTAIAVTVTAADGVTKKTYRIVVTRAQSSEARLNTLALNPKTNLTKVSGPDYADYTTTVKTTVSSVKVIAVTKDNGATLTVNGTTVPSGTESGDIALHADTTTIATTVTAADGVTKKSYVIVVTRQAPPSNVMAYESPKEMPINSEAITVHQNVSPNGDGNSDALKIDGITNYPDNKLQIMSRAGNLVYEVRGYDNITRVFDGRSNDGKLQSAGTYFYSLEYKVGNETRHKTGYIVLKY